MKPWTRSQRSRGGWPRRGPGPRDSPRPGRSDLDRPGAPYVGAPNGVINLETRQVLTGAAAREKLVTRTLLDPYDETAKHPTVDQLLSHLTPENRECCWAPPAGVSGAIPPGGFISWKVWETTVRPRCLTPYWKP